MDGPLSDALLDYLLTAANGDRFERTVQELLGLRYGEQFVPLGGVKDGGADGLLRGVFENSARPDHFVQISKIEAVATKVRATVKRLQEVGRKPHSLTYWSGVRIGELDLLENNLSDELGVTVRIRDRLQFFRLANHDKRTRELVKAHFRSEIFELSALAKDAPTNVSEFVEDPSVFVFLQFEVGDKFSKGGMVVPIVDALIYWALRDTDPDTGKLLSRADLMARIAASFPGAVANLMPHVNPRLKILTSKSGAGIQRVREYADKDAYCLPFAMRTELAAAHATEIALQEQVRKSLVTRAKTLGATKADIVALACEQVIYKHFEQQGVLLAAFLEKKLEGVTISDQIVESELQAAAGKGRLPDRKTYAAALSVLQQVFYTPNAIEDEFLHRLSRTSMLLFSLKHCPRLIDYFNQLAGNFTLLVGTDILVKALSESMLPAEHRHVTNVIASAREAGATLVLSEPVMREIYTHIYATHMEFKNHYLPREQYIGPSLASQSDRILIRTYFYARLLLKTVGSWKAFLNQFIDAEELDRNSAKGQSQLQAYLCKKYGLQFVSDQEIEKGVSAVALGDLTADLLKRSASKREELARNDALMVLAVYARRTAGGEVAKYDGFGLRTWWLTKEYRVLAYTGDVVRKNGGTPYIMRPEFLLNFLTNAPSVAENAAAQKLLPSHVGLQIGQHLPSEHMQRILREFDNWKELSAERIEVKISDAVDTLKFNRIKRYESNLDLDPKSEADEIIAALKDAAKP